MEVEDRISELPDDVLDRILGLLPIHEAARTVVLSTVWRDVWLSLSHLKFDDEFFSYIRDHYIAEAAFYVVNQILMKHIGHIRKFVFALDIYDHDKPRRRFQWFDFDKWLRFLTQNGIEEAFLCFGNGSTYLLPGCIFSCITLKGLRLNGVLVEPINAPCIFPNVTSLHFEYVRFDSGNLVGSPTNLPMLKSLTCRSISDFNITAPQLERLQIKIGAGPRLLPDNLNMNPIRHLQLGAYSLADFAKELSRIGQGRTPLNVEYLELFFYCFDDNEISTFIQFVQMCPKLRKLDVKLRRERDTFLYRRLA